MKQARVYLDTQHHVGTIDRRIFGGFLEHLGRAVYEGIYDPGNPLSDARGFRRDVLDLLRPLGMPVMRYPGGNFVSCYDWTDGIGPRETRPSRPDYAWRSLETNQFGTDEFMTWCQEARTEPMMAVNLGTAGTSEAARLLEYCNMEAGSKWSDLRAANGHPAPYGVKLWCLGNEMDGPWQAGHVPAEVYAQRADQAATVMKGLDPTIELIACGSSGTSMNTYMEWDRRVLEYCWEKLTYISAHRYSENHSGDSAAYLAEGLAIDRHIEDYAALLRYVQAVTKSSRRLYLSFDEWNVWYRARSGDAVDGHWTAAPHLLEEHYNFEDALVVAQYLSSFLRHADVVKIACLAQIVNVIAPLLTRRDGVLVQSIYHPFRLFSQYARGMALTPVVQSPTYTAGTQGEAPVLDVSATHDAQAGEITVFLVNRDLGEPLVVDIQCADRQLGCVRSLDVMGNLDPLAANTWEQPDTVAPRPGTAEPGPEGTVRLRLPAPGFAVLRASCTG
jgi:alpha-N-arabinofuranosidase